MKVNKTGSSIVESVISMVLLGVLFLSLLSIGTTIESGSIKVSVTQQMRLECVNIIEELQHTLNVNGLLEVKKNTLLVDNDFRTYEISTDIKGSGIDGTYVINISTRFLGSTNTDRSKIVLVRSLGYAK